MNIKLETTQDPQSSPSLRYVQACITNVSFPRDLDGLRQMLHKNRGIGESLTDLDTLVSFPDRANSWTAPRWMTAGDLLLFYHAATAPYRIARLQRELRELRLVRQPESRHLAAVLERAAIQAQGRAGHVFAVTEISGSPAYDRLDEDVRHFQGRIFAPFEQVHHLESPIGIKELDAIGISISRQNALTPVEGEQLLRLKELLAQTNRLPTCVANALPGGAGFRGVNASTWRAISCAPERRFIHEGQIRSYLIDYLLDELKDPRTPRLEECDCYRGATHTGRVDYLISLGGRWVPVEAKLNIMTERDLPGQLARYIQIDAFTPTRRLRRNQRVVAPRTDLCLVVDQHGLYVTQAGRFINGASDRPYLTRSELGQLSGAEVRARLLTLLDQ